MWKPGFGSAGSHVLVVYGDVCCSTVNRTININSPRLFIGHVLGSPAVSNGPEQFLGAGASTRHATDETTATFGMKPLPRPYGTPSALLTNRCLQVRTDNSVLPLPAMPSNAAAGIQCQFVVQKPGSQSVGLSLFVARNKDFSLEKFGC